MSSCGVSANSSWACREQTRNGRVESGCVAHLAVEIACCECAGHRTNRPRASDRSPFDDRAVPLHLRRHFSAQVDLRTGDMAVHIDAARHDDIAAHIQIAIGADPHARIRDHRTIFHPDVANLAVDAVLRIVNGSPSQFEQHRGTRLLIMNLLQRDKSQLDGTCTPFARKC